MASTYYAQSEHRPATLTVGELIERLQALDPAALVIFKSPRHGVFGAGATYSIETVETVSLEREERHYPACVVEDEETGEPVEQEAWTQVWRAWSGVVIG